MNRITLAVLTAALAASATTIVRAQDPTRPTPPARHAKPERPAPRAAPVPRLDLDFPPDMIAPMAIDIDQDAMREALRSAQDAMRSVDMDQIREQMRDAQRVTEAIKLNGQAFEKFAPLASLADIKEMGQLASSGFSYTRDPLDRQPPAPWAQGDPADSVYRVAREAQGRHHRRAQSGGSGARTTGRQGDERGGFHEYERVVGRPAPVDERVGDRGALHADQRGAGSAR